MAAVTIAGLDLAKRVFHVHGATADGGVAIARSRHIVRQGIFRTHAALRGFYRGLRLGPSLGK